MAICVCVRREASEARRRRLLDSVLTADRHSLGLAAASSTETGGVIANMLP